MFSTYGAHFKFEAQYRSACVIGLLDAVDTCYKTDPDCKTTLRRAILAECELENGSYIVR